MYDTQGASEGAHLAVYDFTECKSTKDVKEKRREEIGLPNRAKKNEEEEEESKGDAKEPPRPLFLVRQGEKEEKPY
jgi:hypothetical protein